MDEEVRIAAWTPDDFGLLEKLNSPEMTAHLGGPETPEKVADRHRRYLSLGEGGVMCRIELSDGRPVGSVGYWVSDWADGQVWETGWGVLPGFQGRGIALRATQLIIDRIRRDEAGRFRYVHAFPSVANGASNAICRKAGFELIGEVEVEYPKGSWMRSGNWRLDLNQG